MYMHISNDSQLLADFESLRGHGALGCAT
jgi:hypothetical protein